MKSMKTIRIDARTIANYPDAAHALAAWFHLDESLSLGQIQKELQSSSDYVTVEVFNWPVQSDEWQQAGFILEAIQQHSSFFYLIWGTEDDMIDPEAASPAEELVNYEFPPVPDEQNEKQKEEQKEKVPAAH